MHKFYKKRHFYLFILPTLLLYTAMTTIPLLMCVYYSFTSFRGVGAAEWNGGANYVRLLQDKYVWVSVRNTMVLVLTTLILIMPISFLLALATKKSTRSNEIAKVIFFAPNIVTSVLTGLVWTFIMNPSTGLLNNVLRAIGLDALALQWYGGAGLLAPITFGIVHTWMGMGYYLLLWQVGLKGLPGDVLEASLIDGCTKWQQIRYIILPMLGQTIQAILILLLTGGMKAYEVIYIFTSGGPNHASESIVSYLYNVTFTGVQYGYGMTIAVLEFFLAIGVTLLSMWLGSKTKRD